VNFVVLGAPGAGKGTQAQIIKDKYSIPVISTGNMIRDAMANHTELGENSKQYMHDSELVPDKIVIPMIKKRLVMDDCSGGFVLDGYPRTIPQAYILDEMGVKIDAVISLEVDDEVIVNRLMGRRICSKCGTSYHIVDNKPMVDDICDKCSSPLITRDDDVEQTIRTRLRVYHERTQPLKEFYNKQGKLRVICGQSDVHDTIKLTLAALEDL